MDSLWAADSMGMLRTLAAIIVDETQFSDAAALGAAIQYRAHAGGSGWLLRALTSSGSERRLYPILYALPTDLSLSEQRVLFQTACALAVVVSAVTPELPRLREISGFALPPSWFVSTLKELAFIRSHLGNDLGRRFDTIIGPTQNSGDRGVVDWYRR